MLGLLGGAVAYSAWNGGEHGDGSNGGGGGGSWGNHHNGGDNHSSSNSGGEGTYSHTTSHSIGGNGGNSDNGDNQSRSSYSNGSNDGDYPDYDESDNHDGDTGDTSYGYSNGSNSYSDSKKRLDMALQMQADAARRAQFANDMFAYSDAARF